MHYTVVHEQDEQIRGLQLARHARRSRRSSRPRRAMRRQQRRRCSRAHCCASGCKRRAAKLDAAEQQRLRARVDGVRRYLQGRRHVGDQCARARGHGRASGGQVWPAACSLIRVPVYRVSGRHASLAHERCKAAIADRAFASGYDDGRADRAVLLRPEADEGSAAELGGSLRSREIEISPITDADLPALDSPHAPLCRQAHGFRRRDAGACGRARRASGPSSPSTTTTSRPIALDATPSSGYYRRRMR